jgi:hypothetical protein
MLLQSMAAKRRTKKGVFWTVTGSQPNSGGVSAKANVNRFLHPTDPESKHGLAYKLRSVSTHMGRTERMGRSGRTGRMGDDSDAELQATRPERRRYQRHALPCECWLENDELTIFGPTIDVGIGGLFVRTAIPVATGTIVSVTLKFQTEQRPIEADAIVTRTVPAHAGLRYGVGVEFLEVELGVHALLGLLQRSAPLAW